MDSDIKHIESESERISTDGLNSTGSHVIEVAGTRLAYCVSGSGKPLVLMHGWGCNSSTVASVAAVASESHKVYNIDFPGFGASDAPHQVWGVEEYAVALEEFINKLGLESPVLVGHSFGGRVAIVYASSHTVDKLMLVDAAGVKPRRGFRYYSKVWSFKLYKHLARALLPRGRAEAVIEKARRKHGSSDYAATADIMRRVFVKVVNEDLTPFMPKISAPTLLVWGEDDTATPMRDARIMNRLISGSGLVSFPGCGHYSFLDNPVGFAAVTRSFLTSK